MSDHPLIPPIGTVPQAARMFRLNWVANLERTPAGDAPVQPCAWVARQGPSVRLVDIRTAEEVVGPLGYIPGSDWVPDADADDLAARLDPEGAVVLVSRGGSRAEALALALEARGVRIAAALRGGMLAWSDLGYLTSRDPAVLERAGALHALPAPVASAGKHLTLEEIQAHVGEPTSVRWIKLAAVLLHARCACVDGRDDTGVIGTPGGDAGELVLALDALEHHIGRSLGDAEVGELVARCASAFGSMYLHSDVSAANSFILSMRADPRLTKAIGSVYEPLEWRQWLMSPPAEVQDIILEHLLADGNLGCGHLKLMMRHPEEYDVRPGLPQQVVRAWMRHRWRDAPQLELVVLPGGHQEGAVVNIVVDGDLHGWTPLPLVSPSCAGTQMFVNHPQVADFLRRELASFLCAQTDLVPVQPSDTDALTRRMVELGGRQAGATLGHLAAGLPIYEARFHGAGVSIRALGHVGG
ncbi:MAG: rhodanese-like domain-containing protein [Alphaproteobacteria bacterium]|nr:rhodanese-like domain-containing protein [Alphaproteobacteria bacterium]